jgi:hypothetical protein
MDVWKRERGELEGQAECFSGGLEFAGQDLERLGVDVVCSQSGWREMDGDRVLRSFAIHRPVRFRLFSVDPEGGSVVSAVESAKIARRDHGLLH